MSLKDKINTALKDAMKAKDKNRLNAVKAIKAMILLAETEKGAKEELTEAQEMALLTKAFKQRKESFDIYTKEGREDLAVTEKAEMEVIEAFLPAQMSEEEVKAAVQAILEKTGASTMKEMGKVMGLASKELAGKADNKLVSQLVKAALA